MGYELQLGTEHVEAHPTPDRRSASTLPILMTLQRRSVLPIRLVACHAHEAEAEMALPDVLGQVLHMGRVGGDRGAYGVRRRGRRGRGRDHGFDRPRAAADAIGLRAALTPYPVTHVLGLLLDDAMLGAHMFLESVQADVYAHPTGGELADEGRKMSNWCDLWRLWRERSSRVCVRGRILLVSHV
jgi:hypothetical protein